jgi:DNA-binding transcriptional regulator YiaG
MNLHSQWDEDFYKLLGVERSATLSEIATAYHQAKNAYSKDSPATYSLFSPQENQATLAKLENAYLTLSNIDKKRDYDRWLDQQPQDASLSTPHFASQPTDVPTFFQNAMRPTDSARNLQPQTAAPSQSPAPGYSAPAYSSPATENNEPASAPTDSPIPMANAEAGPMDGQQLKAIREKLGLTADDVCRITKIPSRFLKAIESSRPDDLPARVYLQGFIKNLAKLYHLDPKTTVEAYLQTVSAPPPPPMA